MKKSYLCCLMLFVVLFMGCSPEGRGWAIEEYNVNGYYGYKITQAPDSFKYFTGSNIYYRASQRHSVYMWPVSYKEKIEKFLLKNDLVEMTSKFGDKYLFLPHGFFVTEINQDDLSFVWETLSTQYAGFAEMQQKGFSKKKLMAIKDSRDFDRLFNKYIDDCHFGVRIRDYYFDKPTARDEGTLASRDPDDLYEEKETQNAYYIRFTNCISENYHLSFPMAGMNACKKDFIVLDARSNSGGDNSPIFSFRNYLNNANYKGTVICLQDNWSFSSGELWNAFGTADIKFKTMLIGTHSGGMQRFDNYQYTNSKKDVMIVAGRYPRDGLVPDNWLGEGKGYEPQIWATAENMKETLEKLGVILDDIEFR